MAGLVRLARASQARRRSAPREITAGSVVSGLQFVTAAAHRDVETLRAEVAACASRLAARWPRPASCPAAGDAEDTARGAGHRAADELDNRSPIRDRVVRQLETAPHASCDGRRSCAGRGQDRLAGGPKAGAAGRRRCGS